MFINESITKITKGEKEVKYKEKMSKPYIKYLPDNFINHLELQHKCRISHVSQIIISIKYNNGNNQLQEKNINL